MTALVYSLADAYAERARDLRLAAYQCNDKGDWQSADTMLCRARRLENANAFARRGVRVLEGGK
ncbi:MAG: hypothetical protein INF12_14800 [Methylobacterium sp.]|nr:hypothetical protein [Methylobacterium sp.]